MKLSINFIPLENLTSLSDTDKLNLIINNVKDSKILVFDGKLSPQEESNLITKTMENISRGFPGIEICSLSAKQLNQDKKKTFSYRIKETLFQLLFKKERGITVIGPAKIIKEIKRDPDKISLLTKK